MATPEQIAAFREANVAITKKVEADLANFWSHMNLSRVDNATNALLNYVPLLTQRYGEIAATIAADWYELLRADAVDQGLLASIKGATSYRALAADPVAQEVAVRSRKAVESAAGYLWTPTPERALKALQGTTSRQVLQAGRDTITFNAGRDRGARGWARAVRTGGCKFCRMLASNGGAYTERSAHFAAHDDCNCVSYPTFDQHAPKVDVAAQFVASAHSERMSPKARETFRGQVHAYLAKMPDAPAPGEVFVD